MSCPLQKPLSSEYNDGERPSFCSQYWHRYQPRGHSATCLTSPTLSSPSHSSSWGWARRSPGWRGRGKFNLGMELRRADVRWWDWDLLYWAWILTCRKGGNTDTSISITNIWPATLTQTPPSPSSTPPSTPPTPSIWGALNCVFEEFLEIYERRMLNTDVLVRICSN